MDLSFSWILFTITIDFNKRFHLWCGLTGYVFGERFEMF